jgi:hypothetical protein
MRHTRLAALLLILSVPVLSSPAPPRVPVVVELFTSEGCSSCPPADALLAELDRTQPVAEAQVIPLEEHVDYWNSDGWRDPFSSGAFTERQEVYVRRFGISGPYTPQMVVAGRTELLGSASNQARAAIAAAARAQRVEVSLAVTSGAPPDDSLRAAIQVGPLPAEIGEIAQVYLAVTEDGLASDVSAGENSGRRLAHSAVVRKLISAGRTEPGRPFSAKVNALVAPGWKRENLRVVAFLEGASGGQILGAQSTSLTPARP